MNNNTLYNSDCLEVMDNLIQQNVKANLIFADLPYKETGNKWDSKLLDLKNYLVILINLMNLDKNNNLKNT